MNDFKKGDFRRRQARLRAKHGKTNSSSALINSMEASSNVNSYLGTLNTSVNSNMNNDYASTNNKANNKNNVASQNDVNGKDTGKSSSKSKQNMNHSVNADNNHLVSEKSSTLLDNTKISSSTYLIDKLAHHANSNCTSSTGLSSNTMSNNPNNNATTNNTNANNIIFINSESIILSQSNNANRGVESNLKLNDGLKLIQSKSNMNMTSSPNINANQAKVTSFLSSEMAYQHQNPYESSLGIVNYQNEQQSSQQHKSFIYNPELNYPYAASTYSYPYGSMGGAQRLGNENFLNEKNYSSFLSPNLNNSTVLSSYSMCQANTSSSTNATAKSSSIQNISSRSSTSSLSASPTSSLSSSSSSSTAGSITGSLNQNMHVSQLNSYSNNNTAGNFYGRSSTNSNATSNSNSNNQSVIAASTFSSPTASLANSQLSSYSNSNSNNNNASININSPFSWMQTAQNNHHIQSTNLTNNLFESFQSTEQFNNILPNQYVPNLNQLIANDSNNISCNEINHQFSYQPNNQSLVNLNFMQSSQQQHQQHQQQAPIQSGIKISNIN
jgi:hypothetical protein